MSKLWIALVIAAALSLGTTGCTKKSGQAVDDAANATGNAVGNAAKATGEVVGDAAKVTGNAVGNAAQATGEYLTQKKDDAFKATQDKVALLDKNWQELQAKAAPATDEAKAEFQTARDQMAKTLAEAKAKLVEAKDASADTWQNDFKPAIDAALDKAKKLYEDTAAKFGGK
jgi:hypothetical protein